LVDKFFQIKSFLTYWLDAVDEHSLHSPFFFDFYTKVLKPKSAKHHHELFEKERHTLLHNNQVIEVNDFGARQGHNPLRKIASIARTSLSPSKYSSLYSRIIDYFNLSSIIELGTSLGINTLYLAAKKNTQVITFEGSPRIAEIANSTLEAVDAKNVLLVEGDITTTLPAYLQTIQKIDFVFIDANHRYEPTLKYFNLFQPKLHERSIIIMDDIHYSAEMGKAWQEIRNHNLVHASIDLYRCGILFFDPSLNKQHVILQF
jgi:predicted O-methyltransferase YrrM